jgi:cyclic pyranopterin phosphate synthase
MITIYTDGACSGNPGLGGWGAVIIKDNGQESYFSGSQEDTTNNRMEIQAVIEGLKNSNSDEEIRIFSDSTYVINTLTKNWKRNANNDLWSELDDLIKSRNIKWNWVKGHSGDKYNDLADELAVKAINSKKKVISNNLTHVDDSGKLNMVDVSEKEVSERLAIVQGFVVMKKETLDVIKQGELDKGDIITLARTAGITAVKSTPTLIPLCHTIPLSEIKIEIEFEDNLPGLKVTCITKAQWKTGVEIEAFNGVSIACVTIYDMCKSIDRSAYISDIKLIKKSGGKSGLFVRE